MAEDTVLRNLSLCLNPFKLYQPMGYVVCVESPNKQVGEVVQYYETYAQVPKLVSGLLWELSTGTLTRVDSTLETYKPIETKPATLVAVSLVDVFHDEIDSELQSRIDAKKGDIVIERTIDTKREYVPRKDLTAPVNKGVFATIKHHADSMQSAIDRKAAWDNDGRAKYEAPVMTDHKLAIDNGSKARESTKFNTELPLMMKLKNMGVWSKEQHKKPAKPQVGGYWK